jgi:hypothetical protein
MAKLVLKDAFIEVNGVNLSDHCNQVEIGDEADEVETTGFGQEYKEYDQGLKDANMTATFIADFSAGSVDATLFPLYSAGDTFPVKVRPTSDPVAEDNPEYQLTARLYSYSPISGGLGDASTADVTFRNAGDGVERVTV